MYVGSGRFRVGVTASFEWASDLSASIHYMHCRRRVQRTFLTLPALRWFVARLQRRNLCLRTGVSEFNEWLCDEILHEALFGEFIFSRTDVMTVVALRVNNNNNNNNDNNSNNNTLNTAANCNG